MGNGGKIAVTILLILGFIFFGALIQAGNGSKSLLALFALGIFMGIKSMWKKPKEHEKTKEIKLDKNSDIK